jgi:trans-2,3-dihydro-3-hydroxyanthranilate isomerase
MRRRFVTLDVFTDRRFAGNALAVVLDGDGLDPAAMQAVAREFNLSETVFVSPPADPAHRAAIRIFTPASELPFAGHPTVGTAVLLANLDSGAGQREFVLEEGIGPVRCRVEPGVDRGLARFELPRLPALAGEAASDATIAAALGLDAAEIGFARFRPARWSAGAPYTYVPLRDLQAVRRCVVDMNHWDAAFSRDAHKAAYVFCRETVVPGRAFHARMFAPRQGVPEDPATGSAVAAFSGLLAQAAQPPDGEHFFDFEQGYEMGRPSLIRLSIVVRGGRLAAAAVGGEAVVVSEGLIEV